MPIQDILNSADSTMTKAVEHFKVEMKKVRTGRATIALLDDVRVNYYGTPTPLSQVASLSAPDARTLVAQPWEKNIIPEIEKAIYQANLGLNPSNDGNVVRIPVPPLTEERRKDIVKNCKKTAEESRVAVRNIRRDSMEDLKKAEKEEHLSEDDRKRAEQDLQGLTNKYIKLVDEALDAKEKEVMTI